MAESSGASHNVLLGELSGRDRVDAVLARLEATYVNRVSCQQLRILVENVVMLSGSPVHAVAACLVAQRLGTCG